VALRPQVVPAKRGVLGRRCARALADVGGARGSYGDVVAAGADHVAFATSPGISRGGGEWG
jgi:hypothetical protein